MHTDMHTIYKHDLLKIFLITTEIGELEKLIKLELVVQGYKTKKL